jgi:Amt family ammonium transporter
MDKISGGDTAWVLICAGLVMMMAPAVGFFYGGLVRRKNVLTTLMQSLFILALVSVQWALLNYSLAFGPDIRGLIGNLDWLGLQGVGGAPSDYAPTIPHQAFMLFQMMFAVVTPALIIGAFAERIRFGALVLFTLLWSALVYAPVAHWVWADGGWLRTLGALDFAGGTVVHTTAGFAALVAAAMLGRRIGFGEEPLEPHDLSLTVLGGSLLWFGWFGFNGGSALKVGELAASALVATHLAAASSALTWTLITWLSRNRVSLFSAITGAVAGLVAITPASGYVSPMAALIIGVGAGIVTYLGVDFCKGLLGLDDALDVFAIHGVGGVWGMIATGIFASKAVNPAGADGALAGNMQLLWNQLIAAGAVAGFTLVGTWVVLSVVKFLVGLRVSADEVIRGLDANPQDGLLVLAPAGSVHPQAAPAELPGA